MKTWLTYVWDLFRDRLWFLPSLFSSAGLLLAIVLLWLDWLLNSVNVRFPPGLSTTGESARIVLGAMISALVTVAGLAFSLTMLSVSQTSSQHGPRLVRSVFDSNVIQNTLGLFLGTIVFSMIVLRSIKEDDAGELVAPNVSILAAEVAGAACIFSLLMLTTHMTRCIRTETLVLSVHHDLNASLQRFLSEAEKFEAPTREQLEEFEQLSTDGQSIRSEASGYVQAIDLEGLLQVTAEKGKKLYLECRAGDYIHHHSELARYLTVADDFDEEQDEAFVEAVRGCILLGATRTTRQDVEAAILELVEVAVRALSPGMNDPFTAINVVDYLTASIKRIAGNDWPTEIIQSCDDVARIRFEHVSFAGLMDTALNQIRQFAGTSVAVYCRLFEGLQAIAEVTEDSSRQACVRRHVEMISRQAQLQIKEKYDLEDIDRRAQAALKMARREPTRADG